MIPEKVLNFFSEYFSICGFRDRVQPDLFDAGDYAGQDAVGPHTPLAVRMRPRTLEEFVGQGHILGEGKLLRRMLASESRKSRRWLESNLFAAKRILTRRLIAKSFLSPPALQEAGRH